MTVFIFILVYSLILSLFPRLKNKDKYQNYWQQNNAKLQEFAFSKDTFKIILVGSSMTSAMPLKSFPLKTCELGLVGGCGITGLDAIKTTKKIPKIIIIETNWIGWGVDENSKGLYNNNYLNMIKSRLDGLHEPNKPMAVFANLLMPSFPSLTRRSELKANIALINKNVTDFNSVDLDTFNLKKAIVILNDYISYFNKLGTKVYLMELPVNPQIATSKRYNTNRTFINKYLDKRNYTHIPDYPNSEKLETSDGYHLTLASLKKYSTYLSLFLSDEVRKNKIN